jgi:hypothetical protein
VNCRGSHTLKLFNLPLNWPEYCKAFFFDQFRDDDERADVRDDLINQHRDKEGHVDKARAREALVEFLDCKWIPEASPIVEAVDDVQV